MNLKGYIKLLIMAFAIMFLAIGTTQALTFGQNSYVTSDSRCSIGGYAGQSFHYDGSAPNITITGATIRLKKDASPGALSVFITNGSKYATYGGQDIIGLGKNTILSANGFAEGTFSSENDYYLDLSDYKYNITKYGRNLIFWIDYTTQDITNCYTYYFTNANPLNGQNMIGTSEVNFNNNVSTGADVSNDMDLLLYYDENFDTEYTETYISFNSTYNYNDDVNLTYHVYNPDFVTTKYKIVIYYPDRTIYDQGFITENDLNYWVLHTINAIGEWYVQIISYPRLHPDDITILVDGYFDVGGEGYAGSSLAWSKANYGTGETATINYTVADSYSNAAWTQNKIKIYDLSTKLKYADKVLSTQKGNVTFKTYTHGSYGALLYNHNYITGEDINLAYTSANFIAGLDANDFGLVVEPDEQTCNGQITLIAYSPATYPNLFINVTLNDVNQSSDKVTGTSQSFLHYYTNKSGKFEVSLINNSKLEILTSFNVLSCDSDALITGDTFTSAGDEYGLGDDTSNTGMITNLIILMGMPIFWGLAFLLVGIYYLRNNSSLILPVLFILINVEAVVGLLEPYTTYIVIVTWLVIAMNFIFVQKKSTG